MSLQSRPRLTALLLAGLLVTGCINTSNEPHSDEAEKEPQVKREGAFAKGAWKLVDKQKALAENPALIEVKNELNAQDPFSAATEGYFALGSQAHMLGFKHNIDIFKAAHDDRNPTFQEFNDLMKQANVDLKMLYPWQVYAYDEETGTVCILEDPQLKKQMHEEKGIPQKD